MSYFVGVLRYLRPFWPLALVSMAMTLVIAGLGLLLPWPLKILFDSVLGDHPLPAPIAPLLQRAAVDRLVLLGLVVGAGLLLTVLVNGLKVVNSQVETRLAQNMILNFRSDLFQHAQRLSLAYHERRRSGGLIFAINFQADNAAGLALTIPPLVLSALTLIGMFWITFEINAQLAVVSLLILPLLYGAIGYYMRHIQDRLRRVKSLEGESLSIVHEAISMIRVIAAFGREDYEHRKFREHGQRAVDERVKVTVRQTAFSLFVNTTTAAGTALVLALGAYQILQGRMTGGELLVVISYVASIYGPLEKLSTTIGSLQDRFTSLEIAFQLLETRPEIQDGPRSIAEAGCAGRVEFEHVSFSYGGRRPALQDISFAAQPGQVIALVGATGAGKSTLVSLIPRFYEPQAGRVLLDGVDLRQLTLASLRQQISIVLQEPLLFSDTIEHNIRYARLSASQEEIVAAARAAHAHEFIMRLPDRYQTRIGERGARLSGGERQRIALARAFLKNAPILILDEPTSAIDSKTEAVILQALARLIAGRTTFMIAHRLATVRRADWILVLHAGRIVGRGSHDELMARDGLYRQMATLQNAAAQRGGAARAAAQRPLRRLGGRLA